jgi:REP element-mobilizing transposase RayT
VTTQSYRRAIHSVSLLHAHLVFVTKYRRPLFTGEMLTFCEHTMRDVCSAFDEELVEFNRETDHLHLLVAQPPTLAISKLARRLKRPHGLRRAARIHRRLYPRPNAWPPLVAVLLGRLLRRGTLTPG